MKSDLRNNKDFLAGLLFIVIGSLAVFIARDYPMGEAARMGPGYFPTVLGGILFLFGVYFTIRGIRFAEKVTGKWAWRPLALIAVAILSFGFLMERIGLAPTLVVLFFVSAAAGPDFRFKEVVLLTGLMGAAAVAIFIYGLRLPYPIFGGY